MAPTGNFSDDAITSVKNMLIQKYQVSLSHLVKEKYINYYFHILKSWRKLFLGVNQ